MSSSRYSLTSTTLPLLPYMYSQGDRATDSFYVIESGAVQLSYKAADGRLLPIRKLGKGDVFGARDGAENARDAAAISRRDRDLAWISHDLAQISRRSRADLTRRDCHVSQARRRTLPAWPTAASAWRTPGATPRQRSSRR